MTTTTQDQDGRRPELTTPPTRDPEAAIGSGGTPIYGGYVQPIDEDARLTGIARYRTFSEILANVSIVAAGVRYFLNLVSKAEWKVQPADDSTEAKEVADTVWSIMNDMETPWHRVVRRAAMYRFYGFGVQEWTAKRRDDGAIGLLDIEPRPQRTIERWDTDVHGRVLGCIQRNVQTQNEVYLPREKLVYITDDSISDSPEGLGLFRHLVKPAARLQRYEQLEGFGFEGDIRGIPIVRAPLTILQQLVREEKITEAERDQLLAPLKQFVTNHVKNPALGMLLDSQTFRTKNDAQAPSNVPQYDIKLLDGGDFSLEEIGDAIRRVNLELARILGVEHLLLGDGDRGSYALASSKSDNFAMIVDSTLTELRQAFQKDLLRPLWDLNGWDPALKPKLLTDTKSSFEVASLSAVLRDLATAGVVLDREDEAVTEILRILGLPRLMGQVELDPDMDLSNMARQDAQTNADPDEGTTNAEGD